MTGEPLLLESALDVVVRRIRQARERVVLVSPYITRDTGTLFAEAIASRREGRPQLRAQLLTCLAERTVREGFLSVPALNAFLEAKVETRSLRYLHAKVVVVDDSWAIVGSMNFTERGIDGHNTELAAVLRGQRARDVAVVVDSWRAQATKISRRHLKQFAPFAPPKSKRTDPLSHPGTAVGKATRAKPGLLLQQWKEDKLDRDAIADELISMCRVDKDVRRESHSKVLPSGRRSRAYRRCAQLRPSPGESTSIHVRNALRLVLRHHSRIDARAHAAWRLGKDLHDPSEQERQRTVAALKRAWKSDPTVAVQRAAHRRLVALGELPPSSRP